LSIVTGQRLNSSMYSLSANRFDVYREIQRLDPERDCERIVHLMAGYEFPFEIERALEMALLRTFASPSVSGLLDRTKEFANRGQKRYDDTSLIVAEIFEHGFSSERGRVAVRRMNQNHGKFTIPNEDYLYVLSTFVLEPIRWLKLLAWRGLTRPEELAFFFFWREVARLMNLFDVPASLEELEGFSRDYERRHFIFAQSNQNVADSTIKTMQAWFPTGLHPAICHAAFALFDDPLLIAFGYPKQPNLLTRTLEIACRIRAFAIRQLPQRQQPNFQTRAPARTYPNGYKLEELGADKSPVETVVK
jgi:ER-bound oxygenase mpaB/B'/Rubber oxygenase, catalytic domain